MGSTGRLGGDIGAHEDVGAFAFSTVEPVDLRRLKVALGVCVGLDVYRNGLVIEGPGPNEAIVVPIGILGRLFVIRIHTSL
jgi:hypothetical protein